MPLQDVRDRQMPRDTMLMTSVSASTAQIDGARLRLVALQRQRSDLVDGDAEVAADVLEELPRARRALAGHAIGEHLGARASISTARACRAPMSTTARTSRSRNSAAARVRGHAVEVPGAEVDLLAFAGRRHVRRAARALQLRPWASACCKAF
jgi:hypothetical protein